MDLLTTKSGIAWSVTEDLFTLLGQGGLNAAAQIQENSTEDCTGAGCGTWKHYFLFNTEGTDTGHYTYEDNSPTWSIIHGSYTLVAGTPNDSGYDGEVLFHFDAYKNRVTIDLDFAATTLTKISVYFKLVFGLIQAGKFDKQSMVVRSTADGGEAERIDKSFATVDNTGPDNFGVWAWSGSTTNTTNIFAALASAYHVTNEAGVESSPGIAMIQKIIISGEGTCPFDG